MDLRVSGFTKIENNSTTKNISNENEKSYSFNELLNNISSNKNVVKDKNIYVKNNNDIYKDNKNSLVKE